jgi:hypothetical protein
MDLRFASARTVILIPDLWVYPSQMNMNILALKSETFKKRYGHFLENGSNDFEKKNQWFIETVSVNRTA